MVTGDVFRKTESKLYTYFRNIKRKGVLEHKKGILEKKKENVLRDIKECNVIIDDCLKGIDYSKDKVTASSDCIGPAEKAIINGIGKLERELEKTMAEKLDIQSDIRQLEIAICEIEYILKKLDEKAREFVEYKYGDEAGFELIGEKLSMSRATTYRKREDIVKDIAKYMEWNEFEKCETNVRQI
ncbi:MAG: hypothetical protein GT589_03725 [Peptoclostridium sp.]|uniref:hypothetical protein n=1 Tax=Peptoclostridium sp. TaxID=1904860 RepID=UPI00139F240C|nr:hypothetical protein [Peptoclostridium sp.]MZQ75250.1 hypothetical protein [Peptoclostridium sp.]